MYDQSVPCGFAIHIDRHAQGCLLISENSPRTKHSSSLRFSLFSWGKPAAKHEGITDEELRQRAIVARTGHTRGQFA